MSIAAMYFALFSLFSGYLMPLSLLPRWLGTIAAWLPFRGMLSIPVEILVTPHDRGELVHLLAVQAAWAAGALALALAVWRAGVKRFESVGG
jgi:ABC-2 type transport system permease protein